MGKVKFVGPTGKGYSNIPQSRYLLANIKEKFANDEQEMDKELRQLKERDRETEANITRVQQVESQNLKQINMDDSIFATQERAINNNLKTEIQNNKANLASIGNENQTLAKIFELAPTAFQHHVANERKDWDATAKAAEDHFMQYGVTEEQLLRLDLIEDYNWKQGQGFEAVADEMQAQGYLPKEVEYIRYKNKAADYGRLKAYAKLAASDFGASLEQQLKARGITDPVAQKAFAADYQHEYLKAHKLQGLSSDFMGAAYTTMAEAKKRIFDKSENIAAINAANARADGAKLIVQATLNDPIINPELAGQAINQLFAEELKKSDDVNWIPLTRAQARDNVIKTLEDINKYPSDAHVIAALTAAQGKDNFYTQALPGLLKRRAEARKTTGETKQAADKALKDQQLAHADNYFKTEYNYDYNNYKKVTDKLIADGHSPSDIQERYGHYGDQSVQKRGDGDFYTRYYNDLYDDYRLTTADLEDPNIPDKFKTPEIRAEIARREKLFETADIDKRVLPGFKKELRKALVGESLDKGLDESYETALYAAESLFREELVNTGDFKASYEKIITQIKDGDGDFKVIGYGDDGSEDAGSFFDGFSPRSSKHAKKSKNDFTTLNRSERIKVIDQLDDDPNLINTKLFIKPEQLKEIADAIRKGDAYEYPALLGDISRLNPKLFGNTQDLFKAQVKVAESEGLLEKQNLDIEDFTKTWFKDTNDPLGKHVIQNLQTLSTARKQLTLSYRPESVREPQFMSETVSEQVTSQPADPNLLVGDPNVSEYQYDPGLQNEINNMIAVSKGMMNKDEISWGLDNQFCWAFGNSSDYLKEKSESHGLKYAPGKGWYKNFYEFNIRDEL